MCSQFDCQVFDECMETSCFPCRDEIQASLECDVKRDCGIICNCNEETDKANVCISSYVWTGDFDTCSACFVVGQDNPEVIYCSKTNCRDISNCVEIYCGGCEQVVDEMFSCQLKRDCETDCDHVCYDVVKAANDCINAYDVSELCAQCVNEWTCDDLECDEVKDCVQDNCGGCEDDVLAASTCYAESDCGTYCTSYRRLEAPKLTPKKLYKDAGPVNHIGALKNKPHKFGHRLR